MNVLITGAQFRNKGAQSLLFSAMNEFRTRYDDVEIYYLPIDDCFSYPPGKYRFQLVYDNLSYLDYIRQKKNILRNLYRCGKDYLKWVYWHKDKQLLRLTQVWNKIDAVVDISGYALTSKFELRGTYRYMRHIRMAKERSIPVILMPQSFGPFDFAEEKVNEQIRDVLNKVDCIFVREKEGIEALTRIGVTGNVNLSPDLVLQSREIDWKNVYNQEPVLSVCRLSTTGNVGIVPNVRLYRHGTKDQILGLYENIIQQLLQEGKNIYIFRHSNDLVVCEDIYAIFADNEKVHIIREEMNCLEYAGFVRQFEFIVASRFHSIVHSYREGIPAFILGWAIKYTNLAALFQQEKYVFDVTNTVTVNQQALSQRLAYMIGHYQQEHEIIVQKMGEVQNKSCYYQCDHIFKRL